jgi:hypothetical protein
MLLAEGFGNAEIGLGASALLTVVLGLVTFIGRSALERQHRDGERIAVLETERARGEGERLPHRVGALEKATNEIQGDMREIKGDVRAIRAMLENSHGGPHQHRRASDPKED